MGGTSATSAGFYVGCIYEDCRFHPVECTLASADTDELQGTSLIDGSWPSSCSIEHCGPVLLTREQAGLIVDNWDEYSSRRASGGDLAEIVDSFRRG